MDGGSTTIPMLGFDIISNQQEYGAIANGVGENPLNGNGAPLTGDAEGEDMVYSIQKCVGVLLKKEI